MYHEMFPIRRLLVGTAHTYTHARTPTHIEIVMLHFLYWKEQQKKKKNML